MQIRKIIITILTFLCISQICAYAIDDAPAYMNFKTYTQYSNTEMPATESSAIAVYNKDYNLMIYEKNSDTKVYPASTVKIMTAIIAYENIPDLNVEIKISRNVVNNSVGSKLGLEKGDIYKAEDLLKAVLICGSNDAANQLAEYVSDGNEDAFIMMMNNKAKELGCENTYFTNVTGLHDEDMYTTASDMLKIANYAYEISDITNWSSLASYSFASINDPDNYKLRYNRNYFLSRGTVTRYYYRGAKGMSSGSTPQAGNCLITSATKNGITYVCIILGSPVKKNDDTNYAYVDAKKLFDKCFESFTTMTVLTTDSVAHELPLKLSAESSHILLYPENEISYLLPANLVEHNDIAYEKIIHESEAVSPVSENQVFGELIVRYKDDYIIGKTNLITANSFERSPVLHFVDSLKKLFSSSFFIVTMVSALILFTVYAYLSIKSRNRFFSRKRK